MLKMVELLITFLMALNESSSRAGPALLLCSAACLLHKALCILTLCLASDEEGEVTQMDPTRRAALEKCRKGKDSL